MTATIKTKPMRVKPNQYIFPPRAQEAIPISDATLFAELGWIAQLKYNDGRCLVKYKPGGIIELWNRHAERFRTYSAPDWLLQQLEDTGHKLGLSQNDWSLLDGGLLDQKHPAIKDTVVIWDILVLNGQHLLGSTYGDRYNWLLDTLTGGIVHTTPWFYEGKGCAEPVDIGIKVLDNILLPRNYQGNRGPDTTKPGDAWRALWTDLIEPVNAAYTVGKPGDRNYSCHPVLEGLVFKDLDGKLEMGYKEKNNSKWQCRSRVETGRHRF